MSLERSLELNILQQDVADLERHLSRVSGRSLRIQLEIREGAREPEDPVEAPPAAEDGPPSEEEATESEPEVESPEDFYNDPLIRPPEIGSGGGASFGGDPRAWSITGAVKLRARTTSRLGAAIVALAALSAVSVAGAGEAAGDFSHGDPGLTRPAMSNRLVKVWDFDSERAYNVEPVPQNWFRAQNNPPESARPGFPAWNIAQFDDTVGSSGHVSVRLDSQGGSTSLRLARGVVPALPGGRYVVTAMVRTRGAVHSRAVLRARLIDAKMNPIEGSQTSSEPVVSESGWKQAHTRLEAGENAAWIQIDLELLQPAQLRGAGPNTQEIAEQDYKASAWFDDVSVFQAPALDLTMNASGNMAVAPDRPELQAKITDLTGEGLSAELKVYDMDGREVATWAQGVPPGGRTLTWTPELPGYGWYRASMVVSGSGGAVGQRRADFAWLPAPRAIDWRDAARWGVVAEDVAGSQVPLLPALIEKLTTGGISLPAWSHVGREDANVRDWEGADSTVNRMLEMRQQVTLVLEQVPDELARTSRLDTEDVLALLGDASAPWLSGVSPLLSRYGERVSRWQLGPTGSDRPFWRKGLRSDLATAEKAFRKLIPRPVLSVPWDVEQSLAPLAGTGVAPVVSVSPHIPASALPLYASQWASPSGGASAPAKPSIGGAASGMTLVIEPLPAATYGRRALVEDLVRKAATAWASGAGQVAVRAPWSFDEIEPSRSMPNAEFCVWRTLVQQLAGREPAGFLPLAPGVQAILAQGPSEGAVIAWNDRAQAKDAVLSGYLGPGPIRVTDPFGNTSIVTGSESRAIPLTSMPVFVEGVDINLLRFRSSVRIEPAYLPARAERHTLNIVIENPWRTAISGVIRLAEPAAWAMSPRIISFALQDGEKKSFPFTVSLGVGEPAGAREIIAEVTLSSERRYPILRLPVPLEIGLETVQLLPSYRYVPGEDGKMSDIMVTALVTNLGPTPLTLEAFIQAPGVRAQEAPISALAPGESATRRFVLPGAAQALRGKNVVVGLREINGTGRLNKVVEVQ